MTDRAPRGLAKRIQLNGKQKSVLANEEEEEEEIVSGYLRIRLPHQALILISMFMVSLSLGGPARAAGPVLQQDCLLTWNANSEPTLAGYRVYLGRTSSLLDRMKDVGQLTSIRCSEIGAAANEQWFAMVTAYNVNGNESLPSQVAPFKLISFPDPGPLPQVLEPAGVRLVGFGILGLELTWTDPNSRPVSHRIEVSSSVEPTWSLLTVRPPEVTRFSYFSPVGADWACYRVRGETGVNVSLWGQAGGPNDRQFCFAPLRVPSIEQPILAPAVFFEPLLVQLTSMRPGFELTWHNLGIASNRIEVSSSVDPNWKPLITLSPDLKTFTYARPIDAEWVCVRIRAEQQRVVSLWAMAGGPNDRQFCFRPVS